MNNTFETRGISTMKSLFRVNALLQVELMSATISDVVYDSSEVPIAA